MLNLRSVEYVIYTITLIIAYLIAETLCGWFRAYIAQRMGDSTPAEHGFLSLNPVMHIDPIGVAFLIFTGFGWGRTSLINPYNIVPPHRGLKLVCAYFSDACAHIVLACISLLILLVFFDTTMISLVKPIVLYRHISLSLLTHYYPATSSLTLSVALVLVSLLYLCVILGVLNFIINGFHLVRFYYFRESRGSWYVDMVISILLILFFANILREYVIDGISAVAYFFVYLVNLF